MFGLVTLKTRQPEAGTPLGSGSTGIKTRLRVKLRRADRSNWKGVTNPALFRMVNTLRKGRLTCCVNQLRQDRRVFGKVRDKQKTALLGVFVAFVWTKLLCGQNFSTKGGKAGTMNRYLR